MRHDVRPSLGHLVAGGGDVPELRGLKWLGGAGSELANEPTPGVLVVWLMSELVEHLLRCGVVRAAQGLFWQYPIERSAFVFPFFAKEGVGVLELL